MNTVQLFGPTSDNVKKRRPAGVSRREKHRRMQIETLESRQMMTATPISYDYDLTDVVMHDLLMDQQAINSLTEASDLSQYTESQLASVTQWVVFTELGTDLTSYALEGGFTVTSATDIVPGSFIVTVGAGGSNGLISALSNEGVIDYFYPLVPFQLEETAITNDPLLERQWHLVNYGQEVGNPNFGFLYGTVDEDINIEDAWDFYTGEGVVIGIVDSGVQLNHPDLIANIRTDLAINVTGFGTNPNPTGNDAHGTAVAGLAAGVGNNGSGITGVAYNADIAPIKLFSDDPFSPLGVTDFSIAQAFLHQFQEIDIYNHSWGIPPVPNDQGEIENPRAIFDLGPLATLSLRNSVFFGRGGLGSIHVFAAGNSADIRDSGNSSGQVNSRYTIAVGGVIHDGTAASYSEAGAAILVVAPTGSNPETVIRDDDLGSGLTTTDLLGEAGYNQAAIGQGLEIDADYLQDTDYSSRFNGTSAAAPIVSGVIALMLEANPNLTYRDVQHILVRSARQNDPTDTSWITNVNEFFADPLAFDSDGDLPPEEQDTIFDGAWPFFAPGEPGDPPGPPIENIGPWIGGIQTDESGTAATGWSWVAPDAAIPFSGITPTPWRAGQPDDGATQMPPNTDPENRLAFHASGANRTPTWGDFESSPGPSHRPIAFVIEFGQGNYQVVSDPDGVTWEEANFIATSTFNATFGVFGHLATITSAAENTAVFNLINQELYWKPYSVPAVPATPNKLPRYQELRLPSQFTNGAGFTVSQMTTNTDYGYGHGVVDAALAVELAKNWVTVGGQQSEVTWTTGPTAAPRIQPAAISDENTGEIRVPGGISPNGDGPLDEPNAFIDFFNEFGVEDDPAVPAEPAEGEEPEDPDGPFSGEDPPVNTRDAGGVFFGQNGLPITGVPAMTVEWIELQISIAGDENDMDFLRISIVSPDGTVSELKPYELPNVDNGIVQVIDFDAITDPPGVLSPGSGGLQAIYTTNRHWGERTEGKPRINTDGTPARAFNEESGQYDGDIIVDGWRLVIENFSESEMDILTYEIAFHGTDVENTGRIQGSVGVDDNGDGVFSDALGIADNFTRYVELDLFELPVEDQAAFDPRLSYQFLRGLNPDQESWAAGVIVYADLDHNGTRDFTDPSYQVGADGNYFFDLPVGVEYEIRIDPNSLEAAGLFNQQNVDAVSGVLATAEISFAGERVLASPVVSDDPEDPDTIDAAYAFSNGVTSSVTDLNILLVANAQPDEVVDISGTVYADLNENGIQDGNDAPIAAATVYIDVNQNGVFTPGVDPIATTDSDGNYDFDDPFTGDELLEIAPGFYTVRVLEGTTGAFDEPVNPEDATIGFFFAPELVRSDVDFGFINSGTGGGGPSGAVAISGVVFEDVNETGTRQAFEQGISGAVATVYIDANGNNQFDAGEQSTTPSPNGSFVFNTLPPGTYTIRIQFDTQQFRQTTPDGDLLPNGTREDEDDWEIVVNLTSGQIASGLLFGLKNNAEADWGDLPGHYGATTSAQNGARHIYDGNMFLGSSADLELNGTASDNANYDDTNGIGDDEDGVVFSTLFDNTTTLTLTVTASTNGGWLQGWFDWNEDGVFSASEKGVNNILLSQGVNVIQVNVPTALLDDVVFARFRYGEEGINSIFGEALKGEVEDYAIPVVSTAIDPGVRIMHGADFNEDGTVNGRDFLIWQRHNGITSGATGTQGDADSDGDVDDDDLDMWRDDYGTTTSDPGVGVLHGADFNEDGIVNGRDFLIWQRGNGITSGATAAQGDADSDGDVDDDDLDMWRDEYGTTTTGGLAALSAGGDSLDAFQAVMGRLKQYQQQLIALPGSTSPVTSSGAALGGTTEASAHASTFGGSSQSLLGALTIRFEQLLDAGQADSETNEVLEVEDFDAVFEFTSGSLASISPNGDEEEVSFCLVDEASEESEQDSAFELAFSEADWSLF